MNSGAYVTGDLSHLRKPFARNIHPGARVLILSDTAHDPRVWQVVMSMCQELGAESPWRCSSAGRPTTTIPPKRYARA